MYAYIHKNRPYVCMLCMRVCKMRTCVLMRTNLPAKQKTKKYVVSFGIKYPMMCIQLMGYKKNTSWAERYTAVDNWKSGYSKKINRLLAHVKTSRELFDIYQRRQLLRSLESDCCVLRAEVNKVYHISRVGMRSRRFCTLIIKFTFANRDKNTLNKLSAEDVVKVQYFGLETPPRRAVPIPFARHYLRLLFLEHMTFIVA